MINTLDVTISGSYAIGYFLPNGTYRYFDFEKYDGYWKKYTKAKTKTLNLINVESFESISFPIVNIDISHKPVSAFKRFLYSGWDDDKIYDVKIEIVNFKDVTKLKTRSGETMLIDESVECLKNAIDACVWCADAKYLV